MDTAMNQGPDMFKQAANQKVIPDYAVSSAPFGVFFLIAIVAGVVVAITTKSLLLGGIILVGLIVIGVIVTMLLARRQKRIQERAIDEFMLRESKGTQAE
jgi:Flp pilus assembly protein TadB